jgi:hypothetical protein
MKAFGALLQDFSNDPVSAARGVLDMIDGDLCRTGLLETLHGDDSEHSTTG